LLQAALIGVEPSSDAVVRFVRRFELAQPVENVVDAALFATAHGVYEGHVNGQPVSDALLAPGWTAYEWRLQYQQHDVRQLLVNGVNELDIRLADGWYRGHLGIEQADVTYGTHKGFLASLVVTFSDDSVQTIVSDESWSATESDSPAASLYNGQTIDARKRDGSLASLNVKRLPFDHEALVPQAGPQVHRQERRRPRAIWTSPEGKTLVDFGQNLVGWVRCLPRGPRGTQVTLRHAEVIENGEIGVRPLRHARATDTFILSGDAERDVFEPTFTFHGFRYVEVEGWPGEIEDGDLEAVVIHSDLRRIGRFECSNDLMNAFVENVAWSQRGNAVDVPTDSPQRDGRLGWTGDISVFASTASFTFDTSDFLHKWLLDLAAETSRNPEGIVPFTIPDVFKYQSMHAITRLAADRGLRMGPTAIWGDAAVWVPEALWSEYGDIDRLRQHYPAIRTHLKSVERILTPSGIVDESIFQFGDWLDPMAPRENPSEGRAHPSVIATACLVRSARFAGQAAQALGLDDDAAYWAALTEQTRTAFVNSFVTPRGRILSDCVTVYALAIRFDVLPQDHRAAAARRLAELVTDDGFVVTTGFAGTPYVTWALAETGYIEEAYRLLLQTQNPSWLYPVTLGATTVWERWDAMLPDGSVNPGNMTSFNHYALGAVTDWLYRGVLGISACEPGYAAVRIQPTPGPGLDWARGSLDTPEGRVSVAWRKTATGITYSVSAPAHVPSELLLPDGSSHHFHGAFDLHATHLSDTVETDHAFVTNPTRERV
jgi:alpha-L-rhamnosidase